MNYLLSSLIMSDIMSWICCVNERKQEKVAKPSIPEPTLAIPTDKVLTDKVPEYCLISDDDSDDHADDILLPPSETIYSRGIDAILGDPGNNIDRLWISYVNNNNLWQRFSPVITTEVTKEFRIKTTMYDNVLKRTLCSVDIGCDNLDYETILYRVGRSKQSVFAEVRRFLEEEQRLDDEEKKKV